MSASFDISLEQAKALVEALIDDRLSEKFLDDAEAFLLNRIRTRFLAEKDTEGNPWLPSRAGERRRAKGGTGTLFDTGRLFHSITGQRLGPGERRIFTNVPYAAHHQYGTHGLPKREFIGASADDVKTIERLYLKRIKDVLR